MNCDAPHERHCHRAEAQLDSWMDARVKAAHDEWRMWRDTMSARCYAPATRVNDRGLDLQPSRCCRTVCISAPSQRMDTASAQNTPRGLGHHFSTGDLSCVALPLSVPPPGLLSRVLPSAAPPRAG